MLKTCSTLLSTLLLTLSLWSQNDQSEKLAVTDKDWLIVSPEIEARAFISDREVILANGLISRTIYTGANAATVGLRNLVTGEEFIRSVKPEALVIIDGTSYPIGGLSGQKEHGYLKQEWLDEMTSPENAFKYTDLEVLELGPGLRWEQSRWMPSTQWERNGMEAVFHYRHPSLNGIIVKIHYEIFDGLPLMNKWIEVVNTGANSIRIDHFTGEIIAHPEKNNYVDEPSRWDLPNLYLENDYAFGGFTYVESPNSIYWELDPDYTSQVNWEMRTPCVLKSQPAHGPDYNLDPGKIFESFLTYVLILDGTDRERNGLSIRKMYRTLAPWITENPIFLHLVTTNKAKVKAAIDQCAVTGYEMVILSFGSGLNMEDLSEKNIKKFKELVDYAHSKGIELGGNLFFRRSHSGKNMIMLIKESGEPGGAKFGNAA